MVKQTVHIFARIRPPAAGVGSGVHCIVDEDGVCRSLEFTGARRPESASPHTHTHTHTHPSTSLRFAFNRVFDEHATQEEVYKHVVASLVPEFLAGFNCTVMAFGQTGSGKTFSVSGGTAYRTRGIIPRAITEIFQRVDALSREATSVKLRASYLEIYNENVFDLLNTEQAGMALDAWEKVQVREDRTGTLHLANLRVYEVKNEKDCLNLLFLGNVQRMTSETPMNRASSRSHAIFTLTLETTMRDASGIDVTRTSKLHLVDLAGSERIHKTSGPTGGPVDSPSPHNTLRREGRYINLSLHHLEQVILALQQQQQVSARYARVVAARTAALRDSASFLPDSASVAHSRAVGGTDGDETPRGPLSRHQRSRSAPRGMHLSGAHSSVGAAHARAGSRDAAGIADSARARSRSRSVSRDHGDGGFGLPPATSSTRRRGSLTSFTAMSDAPYGTQAAIETELSFSTSRPGTPNAAAISLRAIQAKRRTPGARPTGGAASIVSSTTHGRTPAGAISDTVSNFDASLVSPASLMPPPPVAVHVPYRNSMLTSILRDSLGGNCHTVLLATLNPEAEFTDESVSTCRFASRCGALASEVVVNESRDAGAAAAVLLKENSALRAAVAEERAAREQLEREVAAWRMRAGDPHSAQLALTGETAATHSHALVGAYATASPTTDGPTDAPVLVRALDPDRRAIFEERVAACIRIGREYLAANQQHEATEIDEIPEVILAHLHPDIVSLMLRHSRDGESLPAHLTVSTDTGIVQIEVPVIMRNHWHRRAAEGSGENVDAVDSAVDEAHLARTARDLSTTYELCQHLRLADLSEAYAACGLLCDAVHGAVNTAAESVAAMEQYAQLAARATSHAEKMERELRRNSTAATAARRGSGASMGPVGPRLQEAAASRSSDVTAADFQPLPPATYGAASVPTASVSVVGGADHLQERASNDGAVAVASEH